jgi:hypothetical protein
MFHPGLFWIWTSHVPQSGDPCLHLWYLGSHHAFEDGRLAFGSLAPRGRTMAAGPQERHGGDRWALSAGRSCIKSVKKPGNLWNQSQVNLAT